MLTENNNAFFSGGGEMGRLMREKDWKQCPIGPADAWPKSLQVLIAIILHSRFPMFIWWGPELICFYNDAYRPSLGKIGKHPSILGMPAREAWQEIWPTISPLIQQVLDGGDSVWRDDQLIPIFRNGRMEDVYWTFSYSKINDDEGATAGVLVICVETTEKVIDSRKLKETSELLSFSIEAAALGAWDYDPVTNKFRFNKRLQEWFSLPNSADADLGLAFNVIAEKDREKVKNSITSVTNYPDQIPYDIEYDIINPATGEARTVVAKGKPFFNEKKEVYRFSGIIEDITEAHKAEQDLKKSEETLRNLVMQAPVAICLLKGPDLVIHIANDHMVKLWGKTQTFLSEKPLYSDLFQSNYQGLVDHIRQVYTSGTKFTTNERQINFYLNGEDITTYQNFTFEPLKNENGNVESILVIAVDVTELVIAKSKIEEVEERTRLAAEAGKVGIFDLNLNTKCSIGSNRLYEIFGFKNSVPHEYLVDRIFPEDKPIRDIALINSYSSGKLYYEVRIITRSNEIRWVRTEGKVFYSEGNKPSRIIGTVLDITEKKEEEFKREEYIGIISHELRNPLTSLKLNSELISSANSKEELEYYVNKIQQQANRLMAMTNDFLNVTKISSGLLNLNPEYFHLGNLITDALKTFDQKQGNEFKFLGDLNVIVHADKFRIEQVLINLVSNASKYSNPGSKITISVNKQIHEVVVSVTDEGVGISEDKQTELFKRFSRVHPTFEKKGYGMGLYISQQIIIKHGGSIKVKSEVDKGSTFSFTLPL